MPWTPSLTDLGSLNENVNFSHTIVYEEVDPITSILTSYPVTITATESNPNTVLISANSISGFYRDVFDNTIKYRTTQGTFPVVTKFDQIDTSKLYQMISYKASLSVSRVFSYIATANGVSQTYTKIVTNDWTSGKTSLQTYVGLTL